LASDAGKLSSFKKRHKFSEVAFVLRFTHESSEQMDLAGAAAAAMQFDFANVASSHPHPGGALAERFEIEYERTGSVERAQPTDAIPNPREQDCEIGPARESATILQFCRSNEADGDVGDGSQLWNKL
jgi:hypothetical protein